MSWRQKLAVLKLAGWQLSYYSGSSSWYVFRPNGSVSNSATAKSAAVNLAFKYFQESL